MIFYEIEDAKTVLTKINKAFSDCWEDGKIEGDPEDCTTCNGFLYVCQGGIPDVDCPSCDGTGIERPERVFNESKFADLFLEGLAWEVGMMVSNGHLPKYDEIEPHDDDVECELPF